MNRPQIVIIAGPTATGKTALAIELATRFDAEIIGADSRQVYRYLDVGTAKPTPEERAAAPHHLIDVVNPDEQFDGARFRTLALEAVHNILSRGKRALLVGGTGLYLRALTRGLFAGPPADPALRARLQEQEQAEGKGFLHGWLKQVDPEAANRLHPHDLVRLVRALEVFLLTGTPISQWHKEHGFQDRPFSTLTIGLAMEREALARRIALRCRQMVKDGLIEEVRRLWDMGYGPDLPTMQTIGYMQMGEVLQGRYGIEEALTRMAQETKRLAKRQLTWLRAEPEVQWFAPPQRRDIEATVARFWELATMEGSEHPSTSLRYAQGERE
jgi:tRNA dimethylallyltransferase